MWVTPCSWFALALEFCFTSSHSVWVLEFRAIWFLPLIFQLGWDTSRFNLSTWLGHLPIWSFNLVGAPADSIFQLGWDISRFNLSTWLGHLPIWSFNLVGAPADSIFQLGWDISRFNLSAWLGHQPIPSFNLVGAPANSIFQLGWGTSWFICEMEIDSVVFLIMSLSKTYVASESLDHAEYDETHVLHWPTLRLFFTLAIVTFFH